MRLSNSSINNFDEKKEEDQGFKPVALLLLVAESISDA